MKPGALGPGETAKASSRSEVDWSLVGLRGAHSAQLWKWSAARWMIDPVNVMCRVTKSALSSYGFVCHFHTFKVMHVNDKLEIEEST